MKVAVELKEEVLLEVAQQEKVPIESDTLTMA